MTLAFGAVAHAEGIEVRNAALVAGEEGYFLEADFEIALNPTLEEALNKGVPLYFLLEFEVIRPRWFWLNEKVFNIQQQYRARLQRADAPVPARPGFALPEFRLAVGNARFSVARAPPPGARTGTLTKGTTYVAGVRMRLDVSQLPKPFQLNALASRDWNFGSEWHRWSVTP